MPRRASALKAPAPTGLPLRVNDLRFLNAYLSNGGNGTQAYRAVHPAVRYNTAQVQSSRLLSKPIIQQELASRIRYDGEVTKAYVESSLLKYQAWAEAKQDYVAGASICMDAARVAGLITEKREVKTVDAASSSAIRDLVASCLPKRNPEHVVIPSPSTG